MDKLKEICGLLVKSATVWPWSLTMQISDDIERVQKNACRIILKDRFESYNKALVMLDIDKLSDRREQLSLYFALKCAKNPKTTSMFPLNKKTHDMQTRNPEKYECTACTQ